MPATDDLSPEECRFLLHIGEAGVVAFKPRGDEVIAFLLDSGLIAAERVGEQTALLRLTPDGHTVAARLRETWADCMTREAALLSAKVRRAKAAARAKNLAPILGQLWDEG